MGDDVKFVVEAAFVGLVLALVLNIGVYYGRQILHAFKRGVFYIILGALGMAELIVDLTKEDRDVDIK